MYNLSNRRYIAQSKKSATYSYITGLEGCEKSRKLTRVLYIQVQSGIDVCTRLRLMGVEFDGWWGLRSLRGLFFLPPKALTFRLTVRVHPDDGWFAYWSSEVTLRFELRRYAQSNSDVISSQNLVKLSYFSGNERYDEGEIVVWIYNIYIFILDFVESYYLANMTNRLVREQ